MQIDNFSSFLKILSNKERSQSSFIRNIQEKKVKSKLYDRGACSNKVKLKLNVLNIWNAILKVTWSCLIIEKNSHSAARVDLPRNLWKNSYFFRMFFAENFYGVSSSNHFLVQLRWQFLEFKLLNEIYMKFLTSHFIILQFLKTFHTQKK